MLTHMEESDAVPASTPATASPDRLLLRVAGGDEAAFELLYDVAAPVVYGIARRVLADPALAEETAQEVLVEVWQRAARYEPERGAALSWIATIAHRRAVDRVRAAQSSRNRDLREGIRGFHETADDVEDLAVLRAEGARARQALLELPEVQRQAIALAYYDGLTQHEVAERLGIPLGTVKTRIRDGMIRLRNRMGVA